MNTIVVAKLGHHVSTKYSSAFGFLVFFSTFKSKFEVIQEKPYASIKSLYVDLQNFERNLLYLEKLKFKKAVQDLDKKLKRIKKNQKEKRQQVQSQLQQIKLWLPFDTSISYEYFYKNQNESYFPFNEQMIKNKIQLAQLYEIIVKQKSMFSRDLDLVTKKILANPSVNKQLYELVRQRCDLFEEQLCMNIFQNYTELLKLSYEQSSSGNKNFRLKKLLSKKKEEEIIKKDSDLTLKQLSAEQNYFASEIGKHLVKYNFSLNKIKLMSLKSLSNQGYRSLTPASLSNHLFILGYHRCPITQLSDNLFKLFDVISKVAENEPDKTEWMGQIGYLNSLLFYMLANKIQIYELLNLILFKIAENYKKFSADNQNASKNAVCIFDRQLYCIMLKLLKAKYQMTFSKFKKQLSLTDQDLSNLQIENISKNLVNINSNADEDFQKYLVKKALKYEKSPFEQTCYDQIYSIIQDQVFKIQDKQFICFNLTKIDKQLGKQNGVGEMILQYFKILGQPVKMINPLVTNNCERWSQKQDYFKSKLKGIKFPEINRNRRFDF